MGWPDEDKFNKAKSAVLDSGSCVTLVGPRGTGKTQMAAQLGLELARGSVTGHKISQHYTTLSGLLQHEKDSWKAPQQLDSMNRPTSPLKKAKDVGLLVLDEVQEIAGTEWEMSQFIRLFDERYGAMLRTVLISNLQPDAMRDFVGPSIWSRITETGLLVFCGGDGWESFR